MNAPAAVSHLLPAIDQRAVPPKRIKALHQRCGAQFSTSLAVREQHGRNESAYTTVPPPEAVVFAESTQDVQDAGRLASQLRCRSSPLG